MAICRVTEFTHKWRCDKLLVLCLLFARILTASGAENQWTGAGGDMFWTNSANWSLGLPDSSQSVFIGNTDTNAVVLDALAIVASFRLGDSQGMAVLNISGGSLTSLTSAHVGSNAMLHLNGTLSSETLTNNGAIAWNGGQYSVTGESLIGSSGSFEMGVAGTGTLQGRLINNGMITCFATNLTCASGFQFTNNQTLVIHSNLKVSQSGISPPPSFHNAGTLRVPEGRGVVQLAPFLGFTSEGTLCAESNSVLEVVSVPSGSVDFLSGTVFDGPGLIRLVVEDWGLGCQGSMTVNGVVEFEVSGLGGGIFLESHWGGPGLLRWLSGTLANFTFETNFHAELAGPGDKIIEGVCTNLGVLRLQSVGPLYLSSYLASSFANKGELIIGTNSTIALNPNGFQSSQFYNSGTLLVPEELGDVAMVVACPFTSSGALQIGSNSILNICSTNSGQLEFQSGTAFNGPGGIRLLDGPGAIGCQGSMTVNGTLELAGAQIYLQSQWDGSGQFRWSSGTLGNFTFGTNFQARLGGPGSKIVQGACTNLGEVRWGSEASLLLSTVDASSFENRGEFVLETNCTVALQPGGFQYSQFRNAGALRVPEALGKVSLVVGCPFSSSSTLLIGTNTLLEICSTNSGEIEFQSGTVFNGPGTVRFVNGSGTVGCQGNMTVNGTVELAGAQIYLQSQWDGSGQFRWESGALANFTFESGFQVDMIGAGDKLVQGVCTNMGDIRWLSEGPLVLSALEASILNNLGAFVLETNCSMSVSMDGFQYPQFVNTGSLEVLDHLNDVVLDLSCPFVNTGTLAVGTNSVLEFVPGINSQSEFQSGTAFNGPGVVRFEYGPGTIGCLGGMTVEGTVELSGCYIFLNSTWHGPGLFRWLSGALGNFTFDPSLKVEMTGSGDKVVLGICTNLTNIKWQSDTSLLFWNMDSTTFHNLGQITLETNCTLGTADGGFMPVNILNEGEISVPEGLGSVSLSVNTTFANTGTLLVETNSALEIIPDSGSVEFQSGTLFDGAGVTRLLVGSGSLECPGEMTVNGVVELAGGQLNSPSRWTGPGLFRWQYGVLSDFTFGPGFHAEFSGPVSKHLAGTCTNRGEIRWRESSSLDGEASLVNAGTFVVETNGQWNSAIVFSNLVSGTFDQRAGRFSLGPLWNAGNVSLSSGTLAAGSFASETGSSCNFYLSGITPEADYGQLQASELLLDGALTVTLTNGFIPTNGEAFQIVTNLSRLGQFAGHTLPSPQSNLVWRVDYQPQTITLRVGEPPVLSGATRGPDGAFHFMLTGIPGGSFEIDASTNLVDWVVLTNAPFTGAAIFTDASATNHPSRFYRGRLIP